MSPPPIPVDQVQTKRMIQRQASSGSLSNSTRGRGRGGLQRQNSGGSMTERTFRTPSPSPSRPVSRSGPQAPPIPTIPQQFASPTAAPAKKKKRASSQEAPPPRVLSPAFARSSNRGQSLDRYGSPQQPPPPPAPSAQRNNYSPESNELELVDSRNSVNFSRPLSPRPQSPMAQSPIGQSPVLTNGDRSNGNKYVNPIVTAIPPIQVASIQNELAQVANRPVKKKKKRVVEGSHLHTGTMASEPAAIPREPAPEPHPQPLPEEQVSTKKKKKRAAAPVDEETYVPVPESPKSDSESDSNVDRKKDKRAQRASGLLQKQPSIVREDWEGEQEEDTPPQDRVTAEAFAQDRRPINAANVSRKIEEPVASPTPAAKYSRSSEPPATTAPDTSDDSPASMNYLQVTEPQSTRGTSLSPSRSTRFSDRLSSDLAAGRKHEPPLRSVSPAKPALKHSSAQGGIDGHARGSSITPSESSDLSSASYEVPPKRKKSTRVSFDAQPEIVAPTVNESPVGSPGKERKSWLGLGKSKPPLTTIPSSGDMEELMKPRPQLPSFGSVRGQKSRDMSDTNAASAPRSPPETRLAPVAAKVPSSSATSSEASSTHIPYTATGSSSDHAVGAVFAQEAQRANVQSTQHRPNEPLPPEVTSVEGVLSYSDEETDASEDEESTNTVPSGIAREAQVSTPQRAISTPTTNQQITASVEQVKPFQPVTPLPSAVHREVPLLAISPPTPGAEESRPLDQYLVVVPGGFPVSAESLARLDESNKAQKSRQEDTDDEVTDNDSIYSDAAEDPSEMEAMGFASIDAILESPSAPQPTRVISPPESPLAGVSAPPPRPVRTESWEATQARWSGIAQQTRQAPTQAFVEAPAPASTPIVEPASQVTPRQVSAKVEAPAAASTYNQVPQTRQVPQPSQSTVSQPRRKKKSPALIAAVASIPAAPQGQPIIPPRKKSQPPRYSVDTSSFGQAAAAAAPFRQSMRASSPPEVDSGFRRSMRNENRKSMPAPAVQPPQSRAAQPAVSTPPKQPRAALQKKHIPLATAAAVTAPRPPPKPAPVPVANDSDSESSFRKARRSKSSSGGQFTMRRSMRSAAEPTMRENTARSISPVGRRPFSPPDANRTMRTSMRASMDNAPTMRASSDARRSASNGRQKKSTPVLSSPFTAQNNRSRILDSDDEDEQPQPSKFRSRFADDSDDDVDVPQFAPVRGIPRKHNDEESTDLDDSSDEGRSAPAAKTPPRLQIPQSNTSVPTSSVEALSPNSEKKRGLFGRFRSKKPKDETPSSVTASPQGPIRATTDTSKPSRLGFSSNAERDKMIAQTRAKLEAAKEQQNPGGQQQGPAKLQRRQMPERIMSDSWPLPPLVGDEKPQRPTTSDGPPVRNGTTRLNQGSMRRPGQPSEPVGRSGKKKKFPMLRKAFGLKD